MGGLSIWHMLIILAIVMIIFPNRLPGLGKSLGETIRGFKKGLQDPEIDVTSNDANQRISPPAPGTSVKSEVKKEEHS